MKNGIALSENPRIFLAASTSPLSLQRTANFSSAASAVARRSAWVGAVYLRVRLLALRSAVSGLGPIHEGRNDSSAFMCFCFLAF